MWEVVMLGVVGLVLGAEHTFTSLNSMRTLVATEGRVINFLETMIEQETQRIAQLIRYVAYYEESHRMAVLDPAAYVRNPLNSFHLMKHLTTDWQEIEHIILTPIPNMTLAREYLDLPVMNDFGGAADALCRLQDTYKLNTSDLVKGIIRGVQYSPPMTAHGAWSLGKDQYEVGDNYHAVLWLSAALELNEAEVGTHPLQPTDRATILDYAAFAMYKQGNVRKALEWTEELLTLTPNCSRNQNNRLSYLDELSKGENVAPADFEPKSSIDTYTRLDTWLKFESLCRGELEMNHALVCRYIDHGNPYFVLRRVKMEEMNLDPRIVVFHDVIYDLEIEQIKQLARSNISRSMVISVEDGASHGKKEFEDNSRISQSSFLNESNSKTVATVNRRAGMLANLNELSAEALQGVNYGIGGHYEPHYDFAEDGKADLAFPGFLGNRIATMLFYISDVEIGGATVFPEIGTAVFPRKGSALLWYNLYRDGRGDHRTLHGSCPVLIGEKWACNKWFHEGMNEFLRPCLLESDSLALRKL